MVYVDTLRWVTPSKQWKYPHACHMIADTADELHDMANRLGLRRGWLHGDHYDLTAVRQRQALKLGAKLITTREMVEIRQRLRRRNAI